MIDSVQEIAEATEKSGGRGDFFSIDRQIWAALCDVLDLNSAIAYLVMATGTSGGNSRTKWSAEAVHRRSGMTWREAKAAIDKLVKLGFVMKDDVAPRAKPRYVLRSFTEYDRVKRRGAKTTKNTDSLYADLTAHKFNFEDLSAANLKALCEAGYVRKAEDGSFHLWPENEPTADGERIWLPNALINGAPGVEGPPPIMQFRLVGDVWTMRLFVELYYVHFLDTHHGISHNIVNYSYERVKLGESGIYHVWGFKPKSGAFEPNQFPFSIPFRERKKSNDKGQHPCWDSLNTLERMGLISFIPHLFPNENSDARPLHSLGARWQGAEEEEESIRSAAIAAGRSLLQPGQADKADDSNIQLIIPVPHYLTPTVYRTIRLTFRPHTSATSRWFGELKRISPEWVSRYESMKQTAFSRRPAMKDWQAWGTY